MSIDFSENIPSIYKCVPEAGSNELWWSSIDDTLLSSVPLGTVQRIVQDHSDGDETNAFTYYILLRELRSLRSGIVGGRRDWREIDDNTVTDRQYLIIRTANV